MSEEIEWLPASELPDCDITVLVFNEKSVDPIWMGYWEGSSESWIDIHGARMEPQPTHWAELPLGPLEVSKGFPG